MKKTAWALALFLLVGSPARADYFNPATDWMPGTVGAFMHYWPTPEKPDLTRTFDVPGLVRQLREAKVDFFCLTLGQNSNHYCAPNDFYEELAGHAKGSRCSPRDIPGEIIAALRGTGIRFGLYTPCAPSNRDPEANRRFGYNANPDANDKNPFMTDAGVGNWARACAVWAARYGKDVSLWWFDGAYARIGFTAKHAEMLSRAVKAANPSMVVTFNLGVADWDPEIREWYDKKCAQDSTLPRRVPFREWREGFSPWSNGKPLDNQAYLPEWADFTSGEIAQPFRFPIGQRWIEGNQAFMLTYIGDYWSKRNVRYGDGVWTAFLKDYLSHGGCICFDMGKDEATGLFEPAQIAQLGRLIRAAKPKAAAASLEETFAHPPKAARPQVWWHWMNGNVSKRGITDDLEAMAAVGIGGATIFALSCETPEGDVRFGTTAWFDSLRFAAAEAKRVGIDLTLHNCPGWTSSGGPWVAADDAMKRQVWSETTIEGGASCSGILPRPSSLVDGYYRDAAVVAYPVPESECRPALTVEPFTFRQTAERHDAEVELVADEPVKVTAVTADVRGGRHWYSTYRLEVFASDDGTTWRPVATAQSAYRDKGLRGGNEKSFPVPATTAKHFRVRIVFDVDLHRGSEPSGERDGSYSVDRLVLDGRGVVPKILLKTMTAAGRLGDDSESAAVSDDQVVARKDIIDLTDRLGADGRLDWTAPAGRRWRVVRFGYTLTSARNHPAPRGGTGYEVDKLSADAMRRHLSNSVGRVLREAGDAADAVKAVLIDSYEVGSFNWTADLEKRYARRWGESPATLIPVLTGCVVGSPDETEDVLWRFRTLVSELFASEYAGTFTDWCHAHGLESSIEPYVSPADDREYARRCDIPMGEFWPGGRRWGHPGASRLAPSAAHFDGRKVCAAEAFSTHPNDLGGRFGFEPLALKAGADRMFALGYNRMHINSFVHQPWNVPGPGMTMGFWGLRADRTQPWWHEFRPFMTYLSRAQALLQYGTPVVDVLYYGGDEPLEPLSEPDVVGLSWDLCGTSGLAELTVEGGRVRAPSGLLYEAVVLKDEAALRGPMRSVVERLRAQGARFTATGLEPDVVEIPKRGWTAGVSWTHRRYPDGTEGYFVCSTNEQEIVCGLSFRQSGRRVELWDAETGTIRAAEAVDEGDGRTCVDFRLGPAGSVFVMFRPHTASVLQDDVDRPVLAGRERLTGPWRLTFPFGKTLEDAALEDWAQSPDEDIRYFSGRATYETMVAHGGILDLGDVRNFAVVRLDGEEVATLWKPPYRCVLPHGGRLTVEVVNLWANRLIGDERVCPDDCRREGGRLVEVPDWVWKGEPSPTGRKAFSAWRHYTKDDALLPSGLLGPVTLVRTYRKAFFSERGMTPLDYVLAHPETDWLEREPGTFEIPFVAAFPRHWWTKGPQQSGNGLSTYPGGRLAFKRDEIRANAAKRFDAVFVGDSITHNWETLGSKVLHGVLGKYRILNIGNGNDRTSHTLWDVSNGLLDGYSTPLVVLHIGTNNANRPGSEPETTARGIAAIVRVIRTKQPQATILLMPILPRGKPGDVCRVENERVNRLIRPLADGKTVKWFDLRARFLAADGRIRPGLMLSDNLHPDEGGYAVWAEALAPYFVRRANDD